MNMQKMHSASGHSGKWTDQGDRWQMTQSRNYIAVDLGASSGRLMVGRWDGRRFALDELHRFPNCAVSVHNRVYWDVFRIWAEIQNGLRKYRANRGETPDGIAVDSWGVDFGLLDRKGRLIGNPVHYRDARTNGVPARVYELVDERDIFVATGVQTMQINTLYQLYSMVLEQDPKLEIADALLMIPDLFHYFLGGEEAAEYSEATTSQMVQANAREWAHPILDRLQIPSLILPRIVKSGTILSEVGRDVLDTCGYSSTFPVIAVASHDTASAVASVPGLDDASAFISSGTWSMIGVEVEASVTSEKAQALGFTNEGGCGSSSLLMRNLTGLWILQECMRQWQQEGHTYSWDEVMSAAAAARPFRTLIHPCDSCFQAPGDMPKAIREYCRAHGEPVPESIGEFARCCFESLSLAYWSSLHAIRELTGRDIRTLRIVGGGCRHTYLCQITADACGCVVVSGPAEASALGNVMMQAVATGEISDVTAGRAAIADSVECVVYHPKSSAGWSDAQLRYRRLETAGVEARV